jgi:hypothetical protein
LYIQLPYVYGHDGPFNQQILPSFS